MLACLLYHTPSREHMAHTHTYWSLFGGADSLGRGRQREMTNLVAVGGRPRGIRIELSANTGSTISGSCSSSSVESTSRRVVRLRKFLPHQFGCSQRDSNPRHELPSIATQTP